MGKIGLKTMKNLINISQLAGYIQIKTDQEKIWGDEMAKIFEPLISDKFKVINIRDKKDIWPQFSRLFGGKYELV